MLCAQNMNVFFWQRSGLFEYSASRWIDGAASLGGRCKGFDGRPRQVKVLQVGGNRREALGFPTFLFECGKKRRPRHRCKSRPSAAQQPTAASNGRGRYSWSFFQRGNGRISRFAFTQFDLAQNSHPKSPAAGRSAQSSHRIRPPHHSRTPGRFCRVRHRVQGGSTSSGRTKWRMRCNQEPSWHRPIALAARS